MRTKLVVGLAAYTTLAVLNYGAMNATNQYECHHRWPRICDARMVRRDETMSVVFALIPPWWFVAATLVTSGYQDGFRFAPETPAVEKME